MLINSKDISIYSCICTSFKPSTANYSFNGTFNPANSLKAIKGQIQENTRDLDTSFVFTGSKEVLKKNISRFIEDIKDSIIQHEGIHYEVLLEGANIPENITRGWIKLPLKLTLIDMFESEKSISTTSNTSINITSPKPCTAIVELTANTNVISYTFKINDNEITVKNIKGNEIIYIGNGEVLAGTKSKIDDVDIWEMPRLKTGNNIITVSRADVTLKIKYKQRW